MSIPVRPKKHLGQHFLTDTATAARIADSLLSGAEGTVVEVGPGMGVLTGRLLERFGNRLYVIEIDPESVGYLENRLPGLAGRIIQGDFLRIDLSNLPAGPISIIGNFPYNISTQILFHVLTFRHRVVEVTGMFQREVARRLTSGPGGRDYGILSVLMAAYYNPEYLFSVNPGVFLPPPKVTSGVIRFTRNEVAELPCRHETFQRVVKMAFNQRRKTLRNALSSLWSAEMEATGFGQMRAEQLGVGEFVRLSIQVEGRE